MFLTLLQSPPPANPTVYATGIASTEAFGGHTVIKTGGTFTVYPTSIASGEMFGVPVITLGGAPVSVRRAYQRHLRKFIGRR